MSADELGLSEPTDVFSQTTQKERNLRRTRLERGLTHPHTYVFCQPFLSAGGWAAVRAPPLGFARGPRLTRRPGAE